MCGACLWEWYEDMVDTLDVLWPILIWIAIADVSGRLLGVWNFNLQFPNDTSGMQVSFTFDPLGLFLSDAEMRHSREFCCCCSHRFCAFVGG